MMRHRNDSRVASAQGVAGRYSNHARLPETLTSEAVPNEIKNHTCQKRMEQEGGGHSEAQGRGNGGASPQFGAFLLRRGK
ncbi:hypothetical protein E2C01_087768 [Portunus trituberculatus]|uniref:Uncharacterized protein n=1 Tax=Portunus trituberculatus TaxID=210409 RepID=A0A5B7JDE2_PORTR|nr:hypothetical protein [Portunus trituberculatus]